MQRMLYTDFDLLFDSISATAFPRGDIVPIVRGFIGSDLVHAGYIFFIHLAVMLLIR